MGLVASSDSSTLEEASDIAKTRSNMMHNIIISKGFVGEAIVVIIKINEEIEAIVCVHITRRSTWRLSL